jgi:septum site-determining protein MinC
VNSADTVQKKSIRFRARSFVAFALAPEAPLGEWLRGLDRWTENSPGFFTGRPVLLDLNILKPKASEIAALVSQLAERGIRVYAIEANGIDTLGPNLPPLVRGSKPAQTDEGKSKPASPSEARRPAEASSLIIQTPIRSGQSIFHPDGDVIVLGSVGSGSEIIAAGSIHVYGTLRGRAFAGANGNAQARIFCRKNEAELLAVDGWYRTADDMDPTSRGRPVQSFLENGVLWVTALD